MGKNEPVLFVKEAFGLGRKSSRQADRQSGSASLVRRLDNGRGRGRGEARGCGDEIPREEGGSCKELAPRGYRSAWRNL